MNYRNLFFDKLCSYITLAEILEIANCKIYDDSIDLSVKIYDVATLGEAKSGELSFLTSKKYFSEFLSSNAQFCIIDNSMHEKCQAANPILLVSENPHFSYSLILKAFYAEKMDDFDFDGAIHPQAQIGKNVKIANNALIGKNVKIGDNSTIGAGVAIRDNCIIGNDCYINANSVVSFAVIGDRAIIHSGVKIGQDGFGFAHNNGVNHKVLQIGVVEIGDDVEIGANSCIDRGAIKNTTIGDGTKIDNLVQIAHNVEIGKGCFIAGCAAIAGSTKVGNYVQIGGNAGVAGHITIGDQAQISGMSGVTKSIDRKVIVGGYPARPIREWLRMDIALANLVKFKK